MNLSKNHIKLISSLQQKKYRQRYQLFVAEGIKVVAELLKSTIEVKQLFVTNFFTDNLPIDKTLKITEKELQKISGFKTPNTVLGIFVIPEQNNIVTTDVTVVLDAINDPGNLGTIIRLCDWFGVQQLICSLDTVDCFNPKVIQASMGSIGRISIVYKDLVPFLKSKNKIIYTADINGKSVYQTNLKKDAFLVLGNEANGISNSIKNSTPTAISIPQFGENKNTESLNVATAAAILLSEFRR